MWMVDVLTPYTKNTLSMLAAEIAMQDDFENECLYLDGYIAWKINGTWRWNHIVAS